MDEIKQSVVLDIRVNSEEAEKRGAAITLELRKLKQEKKDLEKIMAENRGTEQTGKALYAVELRTESLRREKRDLVRQMQLNIKAETSQAGSYNHLSAVTSGLLIRLKNLNRGTLEGKVAARELEKQIATNNRQLSKWDQSLGNYTRNVGKYSSAFQGFGVKIAASFGIGFGIDQALGLLSSSINEARQAEETQVLLNRAYGDAADAINDYANELAKITTFQDDQIASAAQALSIYQLEANEVKKLLPLLLDFATTKGVDLSTAAALFGKALQGNVRELKNYGINLKTGSNETERFTLFVDQMSKLVGGNATEAAKSASGSFKQFQNQIGEIKEDIGRVILPILQTLIGKISVIITVIKNAGNSIKNLFDNLGSALANARNNIQHFLDSVNLLKPVGDIFSSVFGRASKEIENNTAAVEKFAQAANKVTIATGDASIGVQQLGNTLGELKEIQSGLIAQLDDLVPGTQEYIAVSNQLEQITAKLETRSKGYNNELENLKDQEKGLITAIQRRVDQGKSYSDLQEKLIENSREQIRVQYLYTKALNVNYDAAQELESLESLRLGTLTELVDKTDKLKDKEKEIAKLRTELTPLTETDAFKKQQERLRLEEELNDRTKDAAQDLANELAGIDQVITNNKIESLRDQLEAGKITDEQFDQQAKEIRRKQAVREKAYASANIIINTARAVGQAIGTYPPPLSLVFAGLLGAIGAAQLAQVLAQKTSFAKGGIVEGPPHSMGGVKYDVGGRVVELEGGEVVINKKSSKIFADQLSQMNSYKGYGKRFAQGGFVDGGFTARRISEPVVNRFALLNQMKIMAQGLPAPVVGVKDIISGIEGRERVETRANI